MEEEDGGEAARLKMAFLRRKAHNTVSRMNR